MKQNNYFKRTLSAMILLMVSSLMWAYDFREKNADGVMIYYKLINNGTEAEVTYNTYGSASYFDEVINIPSTVAYNDKTLSVKSIGDRAFSYCSSLTSVTIPESVTNIGNYAFSYCSSLTSVNIPESVTSISNYTFSNCSGLTSVTIPNSVTSIGLYAFESCRSLASINIPESVTNISERAFMYCSSLTSVNIPNSVTSIGNNTFFSCSSLTSINIPNSVTSIDYNAFHSCISLTSINIPKSVTSINWSAFYGCSGLTSMIVDNGNPVYDSRDNCNAIIETASNTLIIGCQNTIIPDGVTSIGNYAFSDCSGLTSIDIPGSVTSIGNSAFSTCSSLTSIMLPESITSIGDYAFSTCSSLTSINIPEGVTSIGKSAFYLCRSLTSVYSSIEYLFSISSDVFSGIADDATLYVPQGTKNRYEAAGWTRYFSNVVEFNATSISEVNPGQSTEGIAVYGLNGTKVNVKNGDLKSLPRGIYVVNGKKMLVE